MKTECEHGPCNCPVRDGAVYCGAKCEKAAEAAGGTEDAGELACPCAHPDCYRQSDSSLISGLDVP